MRSPASPSEAALLPGPKRSCESCTFLNPVSKKTCLMCGSAVIEDREIASKEADKAVINLLDEEEEEEGAAGDENEDREAVTIPSPVPANESDPASSAGEAMNPFASFTYSADDPGNGKLSGTDTTKPVLPSGPQKRGLFGLAMSTSTKKPKAGEGGSKGPGVGKKKECAPPEDFGAMPAFDQRLTFLKWHGVCALARKRQRPDLETYRFQVLGAVLISAQAQESMVRSAIEKLSSIPGGYTAETLASMEDSDVAGLITFIHYNKAKSKNLVKAAKKVVSELKGRVPVSEAGLLTIPGIGPRLAPLLAFLFRYQKEHAEEYPVEQEGSKEEGGEKGEDKAVKEGAEEEEGEEGKQPNVETVATEVLL